MTPDPLFLTLAEVVDIHADQIERYGGSTGIRDVTLLDSAIAIPQAGYGETPSCAGLCGGRTRSKSNGFPVVRQGGSATGPAR